MKKLIVFVAISIFSLCSLFAKYPKVAVVLSGGGAKGFAQIGVVDEIQKMGIPIDFISGTSIGALIGGFYSAGYSSQEIIKLLEENSLTSLIFTATNTVNSENPNTFNNELQTEFQIGIGSKGLGETPGFLGDQKIMKFLSSKLIKIGAYNNFEDLPIAFNVMATNSTTAEGKVIKDGSLIDAMRASMSLPVVFPPFILMDGTYCMDGGLVDNLPVKLAQNWGADIIISVDVSSDGLKKAGEYSTLTGTIEQTISLVTFHSRKESQENSDVLIKPDVKDYTILSLSSFKEILKKGYEAADLARPQLEEIRDYVQQYRPLVPYQTVGSYQKIKNPLINEYKIIKVTDNIDELSLTDIFKKYIGKELDEKYFQLLDEDLTTFSKINQISAISYAFMPYSKNTNEGILYVYLRDWDDLKSKLSLNVDLFTGFSNQEDNYSWFNGDIGINVFFDNMFDSRFDSKLKLSISNVIEASAELDYNIISKKDFILNGSCDLGLETGGLSPANNSRIKYYIPSFAFGGHGSMGLSLKWINMFSAELLGEYSIVSFTPTEIPGQALSNDPLNFTYPRVCKIGGKFGIIYNHLDQGIFSSEGIYARINGELQACNNLLSWSSEFIFRYSLPLNVKDTLKINGNVKISDKNCQLMSTYYNLGGYSSMVSYHYNFIRRGYSLFEIGYQHYVGDYFAPIYFQVGIKSLTYDDFDPYANITYVDSGVTKIMKCDNGTVMPFNNFDLGIYTGIGMATDFGNLVIGMGLSKNSNFGIVLEFV